MHKKVQKWNSPFFQQDSKKQNKILLFRRRLQAVFVKAVVEISSVFFRPLCCLNSTVFLAIIPAAYLNQKKRRA